MFKYLAGLICIGLIVSGCAGKSKFVTDRLTGPVETGRGKIVALLAPVADQRAVKQEFDKVYDGNPANDIQFILEKDLLSTNLFDKVITVSEASQSVPADVVIEPTLQVLKWEVPDYDALLQRVFFVSMLTGGIGGVIYGSTDTDVHGYAAMHFRVMNVAKDTILDKSYEGHHQEQMAKMRCDTPDTKVRMTGESLKKVLQQLDSDLRGLLGTAKPAVVSSQNQ